MPIPKHKSKTCHPYISALLTIIIIIAFTGGLVQLEQERFTKHHQFHTWQELTIVRSKIENSLNKKILIMRGLVAYISVENPQLTQEEFNDLTKTILGNTSGILKVLLLKSGNYSYRSYSYPSTEKEKKLSVFSLKNRQHRELFDRAIITKKTLLSEPADVAQLNKTVLMSYSPIFLTPRNGVPESGDYWGMLCICIDINTIFEEVGILNNQYNPNYNYIYAIRSKNEVVQKTQFILGDAYDFERASMILDISLPNNLWQLGLIETNKKPCYSPFKKWIYLGGIFVAVIIGLLIFNLHKSYEKLKASNIIDALTRIANRLLFEQYISQEWFRLMRENQPFSLIMCDVDYFKKYNDKYGHIAGDKCLTKVAQALTQSVERSSDLVARYGGEEFAIILPNTNSQGAIKVANKIQHSIQQMKIIHEDSDVSEYITVSLGIATIIPHQYLSIQDLIHSADQALYQAKKQGRDRYYYD